jgi:hypothetical protein
MSDLTIANRRLTATVAKLPQGLDGAAVTAIAKNGADDVVVRVGSDTFVASGRGLNLDGVKPGAPVTLDGRAGQVLQVDRQLNTFVEGALAKPGLVVGGFSLLAGSVFLSSASGFMLQLGLLGAVTGVISAVMLNIGPALNGHFRKVDVDAVGKNRP